MMRIMILLLITSLLPFASQADAQKRKRKKTKIARVEEDLSQVEDTDALERATLPEEDDGLLFPDWGQPEMDFNLGPFGGQIIGSGEVNGADYEAWTIELGLRGGVKNIPLYTGVPSFYLSGFGGYGYGWYNQDTTIGVLKNTYSRWWLGGGLTGIYHQHKNYFEVIYGEKNWKKQTQTDARSLFLNNTYSLLILPHFSGNYLISYGRHYLEDFGTPYLTEVDNWVYAQLQFETLNAQLAVGPGLKIASTYDGSGSRNQRGEITYLKLKSSASLFRLLDAVVFGNYVINDNISILGVPTSDFRYPTQPVDALETLATLPADTMDFNGFVGTSILTGFSVGINFNYRIANAFERNGVSESTFSYGYGISYRGGF